MPAPESKATLRSLSRGAGSLSMGMERALPMPRAAGEMVREARASVVQASTSTVTVEALEMVCWCSECGGCAVAGVSPSCEVEGRFPIAIGCLLEFLNAVRTRQGDGR